MRFYRKPKWPMLGPLVVLLGLGLWTVHGQLHDRLWVEATVNGKSVKLAFDTGATDQFLLPKAAERLGLAFTSAPRDVHLDIGESPTGRTEECELRVGDNTFKTAFGVVETPKMLAVDLDGVLGWR